MKSNKYTGTFYTPKIIADFIIEHIFKSMNSKNISVLEPSVGNGIFIECLNKNLKINKVICNELTIVDIDKEEINKSIKKIDHSYYKNINVQHKEFLSFSQNIKRRYSIIIGNPPYIKRNYLSESQIKICKIIHDNFNLADRSINNIWTSFVLSALSLLEENGILAFVLPADLLQVKYANEIRNTLEKYFDRIEIFTIDKNIFEDIDQLTILFFGYKNSTKKGVFFYDFVDLSKKKYKQISSNGLMISNSKWTHYNLNEMEIALLNKINKKLTKTSEFIRSAPGIVTGANNYFILAKSKMKEYNLDKYCKPIIQKGSFVNGKLIFRKDDYLSLVEQDKPSFLLSLKNTIINNESNLQLKNYLNIGIDREIDKRHKCQKRQNWYEVPTVKNPTQAFFFKRCHLFPKLVKNSAKIYVTDAAYNIETDENINIDSFIFSFYNIVTMIFAELMGRKYGGGVLELTPLEFKNLPIPYVEISKSEFNKFATGFEKQTNKIEFIIDNSSILMKNKLKLEPFELEILKKIYMKLLNNRINNLNFGF